MISKNEVNNLEKLKLNVNSYVYYMWLAWVAMIPLMSPIQVNWQCANTDRTGTCTYTPSNVNMNWHYSTVATCQSNDCDATCDIQISEILNWLLTKTYQCDYHVNHSASWDSWSGSGSGSGSWGWT